MPSALAIDLRAVTKTFSNGVVALRRLSMQVARGEIFGLLGPNGAGKSTLVKVLMTLVRPNHCQGWMLGKPVGHVPTLRRVGYLPEHVRFPAHLTSRQLLEFVGRLHGVPTGVLRTRIPELLMLVGMARWTDERLSNFSKGMKQRVGLAQALINDPDLLFLDEPTDGVDPVGRKEMRQLILELKSRGKAVFVNSHLLSELEMICDRVAILTQGQVVKQGTLAELTQASSRYELCVEGTVLNCQTLVTMIKALGGSLVVAPDERQSVITLPTRRPQAVQPLIDEIRREGLILESVTPARQSLEELFMDVVLTGAPPTQGQPEAKLNAQS